MARSQSICQRAEGCECHNSRKIVNICFILSFDSLRVLSSLHEGFLLWVRAKDVQHIEMVTVWGERNVNFYYQTVYHKCLQGLCISCIFLMLEKSKLHQWYLRGIEISNCTLLMRLKRGKVAVEHSMVISRRVNILS